MIVRRLFPLGAASLLFVLCSTAAAQDFQKTYHLSAGSTVAVHNISGDVHVTGYEGNTILVSAFKQ